MAEGLEYFKKKLSSILKIDVYCGLIIGIIYAFIGFFGGGLMIFLYSLVIYSILWIIVGIILSFIFIYIYKHLPGKKIGTKILSHFLIFLVLIPIPFALFGNLNFSFGYMILTNFQALFLLFITSLIFSFLFDYFWKKVK